MTTATRNAREVTVSKSVMDQAAAAAESAIVVGRSADDIKAEIEARVQAQLDEASTAKSEAEAAAASIREAKGDIGAERERLLAEADAQAERLLTDGRARLEQEVADLRTKAASEADALRGRVQSEVQAEVAAVAAQATETLVADSLDDELRQALVEQYISTVGASA